MTRKVRRNTVADRYGELIDALYSGVDVCPVEATVTFEEDSVYDQSDASGFIRLNALRLRTLAEQRLGEGE